MNTIDDLETLHALYGQPAEAAIIKVTDHLTPQYQAMIEASPFMMLATCGPEGLDCSPRGDRGSVVTVADPQTLLLPDWRGNNRVDSLANIVCDPRIALLFLIPGSQTAIRVNGRAVLSIDPRIIERFEAEGKHPRCVVVITIGEVYSQCGRAVMRSGLWDPEKQRSPGSLPSVGDMLQGAKDGFDGKDYDRRWPDRAGQTLW